MRHTLTALFLLITSAASADVGGTTLQDLTRDTTIIDIKSEIDAKTIYRAMLKAKIDKQMRDAKDKAEEVLSEDELRAIKERADRVLESYRRFVEQLKIQQEQIDAGAMIFCSSTIIEEGTP